MKRKVCLIIIAVFAFMITVDVHAEGWKEKNGYKYYEDANGDILTGFQPIEGKVYFLSRDKTKLGAMKTGMLNVDGKMYCLNPTLQTGPFKYQGKEYYANENGEIQIGFQTVNEKIYFYSRAKGMYGVKRTGMLDVDGKKYYLNPEAKTGPFTYQGKEYYANEKGEIQIGFQTVNGKIYFYSRAKGMYGVKRTGMLDVDGKKYYLNPEAKIGPFKYQGKEYYANDKGEIQIGFQTVNGKIYFYSRAKSMYGVKRTGMLDVDGKKYYLNPEAKTGPFTYQGKEYYANDKGEIQVGFQTVNGNKYFYSRAKSMYGVKRTGLLTIDNKMYYLNPYVKTGWLTINNNKYYANADGTIAQGFKTIDGEIYFFSYAKGKEGIMRTGWINYNDNYYYLDADGKAYRNLQTVDGRSYLFNATTGKVEGFKIVNGKKYYYNPDGTQAKGVQYMMERFWKFDEVDGAFKKFVREVRVIDISVHNGTIDWNKVKASKKVDAVILRLGYGIGFIDTNFLANKAELERLGIPYSVYLFSYAENKNEALKESDFLVKTIKDNKVKIASNIFSIYYDLEDWVIKSTGENSYGISKNTYKDMITTFISNTEKKLCIKTRVYASKNYIETRFPSSVQNYATWVAQWSSAITYKGPYEGWQYSDCGSVPGINGCVDMSKFYY